MKMLSIRIQNMPMQSSWKMICKSISKMLSLHRQSPTHLDAQARALAAREKAVYKMKMLARRCTSVAAENR